MPKLEITSQERSALRAAAHPLRPVVLIGDRGLTESVLKEIDVHLTAHQLIKVRVAGDDREARDTMLQTICEKLSCAPVHHLGKTLILYRPNPKAAKAEEPDHNATRAVRKPNEPYTPKKQAATGEKRTRQGEAAKRASAKAKHLEEAPPKARRSSATAGEAAPHRIPRRSGSALSLRAGARKNVGSRGGAKR